MIDGFRRALRSLSRSKPFVILAVVTLAVGIGVTVAMFAVVDGIVIEPLPYPQPSRLVLVSHLAPGLDLNELGMSPALYLRYRKQATTLQAISRFRPDAVTVAFEDRPAQQVEATRVSWTLSAVLGVGPVEGRFFSASDELPGAPRVAVLLDRARERLFGGRRSVVGSWLQIDGEPVEVVGVMPPGFSFPRRGVALLLIEQLDPRHAQLGTFDGGAIARLATGVERQDAEGELDRLLEDLTGVFPDDDAAPILQRARIAGSVTPYRDEVLGSVEGVLWVLLGGIGLILLIAIASVANLFLVRAEVKQRELAVKVALGASRRSIFGAFFSESLLLAAFAGALGVALAGVAVHLFAVYGPSEVPRLDEVAIDGSVLLFGAALVVGSALLLGLVPMASQSPPRLLLALREGGRGGTGGRGTVRLRRLLVGCQVAIALVLLVGAGLAVRSLIQLGAVDLGFQGDGVVVFRVSVPEAVYDTPSKVKSFHRRALEQLAALPGVRQAAAVSDFPLSDSHRRRGVELEDYPLEEGEPPPMFGVKAVSGDFFPALRVPLIEGRLFDDSDAKVGARSVLISDAIARRFFPHGSAVGRRLVERDDASSTPVYFTIVGVVGSLREEGPGQPPTETLYYPLSTIDIGEMDLGTLYYLLRTDGDPRGLIEQARAKLAQLDRGVPMSEVTTVRRMVRGAEARYSFSALLLSLAASLAVVFAALGLYGVVSFLVAQRTREIGVRVALGASTGEIQRLVLREGVVLAIAGIAAGWLGAVLSVRWLRTLLFEISPFDPTVFLTVAVLLVLVCLLACFVPARRAALLEPSAALRED